MEAPPDGEAEAGGGPLLSDEERLVDICGCTSDEARAALLAAGPGGLALAVDFVLGAGSALKERERDEAEQPPKLVCLVRADLGMGTGKVAAQVAHAALSAYRQCELQDPACLQRWLDSGEPTIVLGVGNEAVLLTLLDQARSAGLRANAIRDAGRTQVDAGTLTVGAIGPNPASSIDVVTGHLSLL